VANPGAPGGSRVGYITGSGLRRKFRGTGSHLQEAPFSLLDVDRHWVETQARQSRSRSFSDHRAPAILEEECGLGAFGMARQAMSLAPADDNTAFREATLPLTFDLQFVQLQELPDDRLGGFFHLGIWTEENRFPLMQKDHAVGKFLGQAHVVSNHDTGQAQLELEPLDEVSEKLRHQRVDHGGGLIVKNAFRPRRQGAGNGHGPFHSGGEIRRQ